MRSRPVPAYRDDVDGTAYPQVRRMDPVGIVAAIREAGGPRLVLGGPMSEGAVGASTVLWPDGHEGVLTWAPPPAELTGTGEFARARALLDVARRAGVPAPAYEAVVTLGDGSVAVVQERARGVPVTTVTSALIDRMLELAERRQGLLAGTDFASQPSSLYLTSDGPGFCLHAPLRAHDRNTRALLATIEAIGADDGDTMTGPDLVHYDYHLGNVLVEPSHPGEVTAIVDWGGARGGVIGLDLVILAFDLTRRSPSTAERVEQHLQRSVTDAEFRRLWAHASLRLVDWALRHNPEYVDHWITVAQRHL